MHSGLGGPNFSYRDGPPGPLLGRTKFCMGGIIDMMCKRYQAQGYVANLFSIISLTALEGLCIT